MTRPGKQRLLVLALVAVLGAVTTLSLRPAPVRVEVGRVDRGDLRVTVEAPGKTRIREVYIVTAPVAGVLERVSLHEGDAVAAGAAVARVRPLASSPLDPRSAAEAEARLRTARAGEAEALAAAERARVARERAGLALARARALVEGGAGTPAALEETDAAERAAREEERMAQAAARRAAGEVEAARAVVAGAGAGPGGTASGEASRVLVRAPVAGRVLRVHRESEGPVTPGTPVLDLGDGADLEVVVELLSSQAVRVPLGAPASVVRWGGEAPLHARVVRLDPAAFTKVSALGVEEQRVRAVLVPEGPGWERLGDGYALDALVTVSEARGVVRVSTSALVREGDGWAVFAVEAGRARLRRLELGAVAAAEAEVRAGLAEGAAVVLHPGDGVVDGARVEAE